MCPCDLSREYVCDGCARRIEDLYSLLLDAEAAGSDLQRHIRGEIDKHGLKANIVLHRLTGRQYV